MTKKGSRKTEISLDRITFAIAGALACAISLADIFGLLNIPLLQQRFTQFTLLAAGLILAILATTYTSYLEKNREQLGEIERRIEESTEQIGSTIQSLDRQIRRSVLEQLTHMVEDADPALLQIFRPYLEGVFQTPYQVMTSKRFKLNSLEGLQSYHRLALEANPGATFLATSHPSRRSFWHSDHLARAIREFIEGGGTIVRIFFVQKGDALDNSEVQQVLADQERWGVTVYLLDTVRVPPEQRKSFFVAKNGAFAWELLRGPDDQFSNVQVTADPLEVNSYLRKFDLLLKASVRYSPGRFASRQIGVSDGEELLNYSRTPEAFREFELLGWESVVDQYHHRWGGLTSQAIGPLLDALDIDGTTRLLDVACGPGYVAAAAEARASSVVGIDFSNNMVNKARALYPGLEFHTGDAEKLPFEDETFDAVAMNFGMLHLASPMHAMKEALRVLRPKGRFAFTVWARPEEAVGFKLILQAVEKFGEDVTVPQGPDLFFYSRPEECKITLAAIGYMTPSVMLVDLSWRLASTEDIFPSFYAGTARIGGLLRRQPPLARQRVEEEVRRTAAEYRASDGTVEIPMPALLAWATKG